MKCDDDDAVVMTLFDDNNILSGWILATQTLIDENHRNKYGSTKCVSNISPFPVWNSGMSLSIMHLFLLGKSFNQGFSSRYWSFRKTIFQVWTFPENFIRVLLDTLRFSGDSSILLNSSVLGILIVKSLFLNVKSNVVS